MGPAPAVAAVRLAVRRALDGLEPGDLVLVACSGGADSLALAGAAAFEGPPAGLRVGAVTVDHGLQAGSSARATAVAETLRARGLDPVEVATVGVTRVAGAGGPEAAARTARYAALDEAGARLGAAAVLLGHTLDDQAEGVLLGLARGSGARSLAGMPSRSGRYLRPLLDLGRDVTAAACAAEQLEAWADPHNSDAAYARARVRQDALPVLEKTLGPGVAEALARTARLLRDDADALDGWADAAWHDSARNEDSAAGRVDGAGLDVARLADLPAAVRRRVLRAAAVSAGCPAGSLSAAHLQAVDALVTDWRGQSGVDLPGGVVGRRQCDRLLFTDRRTS